MSSVICLANDEFIQISYLTAGTHSFVEVLITAFVIGGQSTKSW